MVISPSDSSRRRHIMSKHIPGNQKHLTLETVFISKNELNKGTSFKDMPGSCARIPPRSQKKSGLTAFLTGTTKGPSIMQKTSVSTAITVRRPTPAERLSCAESMRSCPTCNQTAGTSKKNACSRLDRAPYVCNGCTKKISHCTIAHKYSYNARFADRKYREKLRDSRTGINMTSGNFTKKIRSFSSDRTGTVSLSYPDKPPGTGYVCPYDVFLS